jgi:DNA-binding response OmpR family regulator
MLLTRAIKGTSMAGEAPDGPLASRRVLVVEDEFFLADDMAAALRALGAEVVGPAPTRDMAMSLLAAERVDAAVLDMNLRGEMIFPVADALRARGVPFVFATGYDASATPPAYRDVPRWEKPFDPEELVRALPDVMGEGRR